MCSSSGVHACKLQLNRKWNSSIGMNAFFCAAPGCMHALQQCQKLCKLTAVIDIVGNTMMQRLDGTVVPAAARAHLHRGTQQFARCIGTTRTHPTDTPLSENLQSRNGSHAHITCEKDISGYIRRVRHSCRYDIPDIISAQQTLQLKLAYLI